jgi:hypothetical protein
MQKVKPEQFGTALSKYLNEYREDIQEDVEETTSKVTKEAIEELKTTSPKRKGRERGKPYYKGWSEKTQTKGKFKYSKVIWNKTNYQLTHLLEFGHRTRNGTGWVEAQPHIRPVEEKYNEKFTDLLKQKIRSTK